MTENLTEAIRKGLDFFEKKMNTCILVEVVAIRNNKVDLKPLIRGKEQDEQGNIFDVDLPNLLDIPVLTLQAGGFSIRMPIAVGDQGLALVNQRDIRNWKNTEQTSNQTSLRRFNVNDSFYLGAILPKDKPLSNDGVYIYNDQGLFFSVKSDKVETNMDIHCQQVFCTNINMSGNMNSTGGGGTGIVNANNVVTPSVSDYNNHTHGGVDPGSGNSGGPN